LDVYAALIVLGGLSLISLLIILEGNISLALHRSLDILLRRLLWAGEETAEKELTLTGANLDAPEEDGRDEQEDEGREEVPMPIPKMQLLNSPTPAFPTKKQRLRRSRPSWASIKLRHSTSLSATAAALA
jgi:hypothetical protein